jgi:DNA-binding MarR family transcriptional regulator
LFKLMPTRTATAANPDSAAAVPAETAPRLRSVVMRLSRLLRQQSNGPGSQELTATLISALATVGRLGPLTFGDLADAEGVQPPSITRVVAKLEDLGLVNRTPDERDRRIAWVKVTPAGERFLEQSRKNKNALLARRLATLTPDQLATLEAALPVLERLLEPSDHGDGTAAQTQTETRRQGVQA